MNTLYIVWEDNHGNLAITDSYEKAIDFLFDENWIDIPCGTDSATYKTYLKGLTVKDFNNFIYDESGDALIGINECHFQNGICKVR